MIRFSCIFSSGHGEFPSDTGLGKMLRKAGPPLVATLHFLMGCSGGAPAYASSKPEDYWQESQIICDGRKTAPTYFRKGIYAGVELSAGMGIAKGNDAFFRCKSIGHPDYAFALWGGWRALPQFAVALGFEGSNSISTGTTSVPVFLRIRSDILDRRISPYIQIDAGYTFQFAPSGRRAEELKLNTVPFPEKYRGFASAEEYLNAHIADYLDRFSGLPQDELDRIAAEERAREWKQLCSFSNGSRHFLPWETYEKYGCFSKDGFFGCITLGAGFGVGKEHGRLSLGISAGLAQYSGTVPLRTQSGKFLKFSVPDSLPDGSPVLVERTSIADNHLRAELRLRLSYDF